MLIDSFHTAVEFCLGSNVWALSTSGHWSWKTSWYLVNLSCLSLKWTFIPSGRLCLLDERKGFLHISYMDFIHHLYFKTPFKISPNLCQTENDGINIQITFLSPKRSSQLGLETYQETSLSTRARSNWFRLRFRLWLLCSHSPNKPNKGRNCSGVQSKCPKKKQQKKT